MLNTAGGIGHTDVVIMLIQCAPIIIYAVYICDKVIIVAFRRIYCRAYGIQARRAYRPYRQPVTDIGVICVIYILGGSGLVWFYIVLDIENGYVGL